MVTVPAFLPVTTPFASTEAMELLLDLYRMVPVVSAGSKTGVICTVSLRPMLVRRAVRVIFVGSGTTVTLHTPGTPL